MKKTCAALFCASAAACLLAADVSGFENSRAGVSCAGMRLSICPRRDFELIRNGCGGDADYIWIEARDLADNPIPFIPETDYWFNACNSATPLFICPQPMTADSMTGLNGRTTFSTHLSAGGCALTGGIWISIQGYVIKDPARPWLPLCIPVVIKSPDITGAGGLPDGVVNLSDLIPFGSSYNTSPGQPNFNACCDFNDDDLVNLGDFAYFGQHYQHGCF